MKCPYCQTDNVKDARFCANCGKELLAEKKAMNTSSGSMQAATNAGIVIGAKARQARITEAVDSNAIVDVRLYNSIIVGVLAWGLLVNYVLCKTVGNVLDSMNPIVFLVGYAVLAISGTILSARSQKPLISFLGYNMVVIPFGLVISTLVDGYTKIDPSIVTYAFLYTLLIAAGMFSLILIKPELFAHMGGALGGVLIGVILCEIVLAIFHVQQQVTDWIVAGLFSLYIGYDIYRSQQYPKTVDNAIDSALDIYMDLANLFIRLLSILAKRDD